MPHVVRRAVAARRELDVVVEARTLRRAAAARAARADEEAAAEGGEAEHHGDDPHRRVLLPRRRHPRAGASQHEIDPGPGTTSVFPVLIQMPLPTASQNQTCAIVLMSGSFPFGS